jgi:hypothetical protein
MLVLPDGSVLVGALTGSTDMPVAPDAVQAENGGGDDAVFAILRPDGARVSEAT